METYEHTDLGNQIQYHSTADNPYVFKDNKGVLHVTLMRDDEGIPLPLKNLTLSAGQVVALSGDYFTKPGWAMVFDIPHSHSNANYVELNKFLIRDDIREEELQSCTEAYNNLASPTVKPSDVEAIYDIKKHKYIPFSLTLSKYIQELMLYLKVKDYASKVDKNQAHFTPWATRAYIIGHNLAMRQARISYELMQLAENPHFETDNPDTLELINYFKSRDHFLTQHSIYTPTLIELANRFHAMAVSIELSTHHYYSDSFAAGHMSRMGFLREELPKHNSKFLGGLLVNNMHNEDNKNSIYVKNHYDPHPEDWYQNPASGDDNFSNCKNYRNKANCIKGMSLSLADIEAVRQGKALPAQVDYSGLGVLPDVDADRRQPQPLFVFYQDQVYRRKSLKKIKLLGPTDYEKLMTEDPSSHGYVKLKGKWDSFKQVVKLRALSFIYKGKIVPLSAEEEALIAADELQRNNGKVPEPDPICPPPNPNPKPDDSDWRKPVSDRSVVEYMNKHGILTKKKKVTPDPEPSQAALMAV